MNISNNNSEKPKNKRRKCAFFDRDGVLIKNYGYVHNERQIKFLKGTITALKFLKRQKFRIIVITNQSGIARGYFSEKDLKKFHKILDKKISKEKIIDKYYFCPFHPTKGIGFYKKESKDRKPNNGMIIKAVKEFNIDLNKSFMIGDNLTDYKAAKKSGLKFYYKKGCLLRQVKRIVNN